MHTHERRLKRSIIKARIAATEKFQTSESRMQLAPVPEQPPSAQDTERDAYCRPEYCPPTKRSPVGVTPRSMFTGKALLVEWEDDKATTAHWEKI